MRVKIFFSVLLLLMLNVATTYAQLSSTDPGEPCGGQDDDTVNCPLDTWVILLAVVAVVFVVIHLNKKQKRATLNMQG